MAGMAEVGRLFNNNELIVAEVLQSAEAMKAAVNHLEQFMEKADTAARGKVILATVKGDVHDIGKNLVEIILGEQRLQRWSISASRCRRTTLIQRVSGAQAGCHRAFRTAGEERAADGDHRDRSEGRPASRAPLLVGGAALSEKFTRNKIAPGVRRGGLLREGRHDRAAA